VGPTGFPADVSDDAEARQKSRHPQKQIVEETFVEPG
jgi:hypothetical protein